MACRGASVLLLLNWLFIAAWLIASFQAIDASIIVLATNNTYVDRVAAFGPRIPEEGIILNLIAVGTFDDGDQFACAPVKGAPNDKSWVALVERGGDCSFVEKVRNMQASGAGAVIVGDNQRGGLVTMYARDDTSDVLIPSVFIAQQHYRELRYLDVELGKGFLVKLTPDEMDWPIMDVIIFIVFSPAFVIIFLYFLWRVRLRQQRLADLAPTEVVSNLPIKVFYTSKLKENDPLECVICLEDYKDEDEIRILPCKHEYHVGCIDNWLTTRKKFCPICKRDICTPTESTPLLQSNPLMDSYRGDQRRSDNNATTDHSRTRRSGAARTPSSVGAGVGRDRGDGRSDAALISIPSSSRTIFPREDSSAPPPTMASSAPPATNATSLTVVSNPPNPVNEDDVLRRA
ncbi:hypothetical protein DFQ26_006998 [Actinomortierella ambigua]|nr:hypothetical protein DFQ26_006998 [Actinomortierella ambigua]